jgi:hypothetical protein
MDRTATGSGSFTSIIDGGCITCTDSSHFAMVSSSSTCLPIFTANGGTSWAACSGLPAAQQYISNGAKFDNCQCMTNDAAGNMYLFLGSGGAGNVGTYKSTDGGATWSRVDSVDLTSGSPFNLTLQAVPGLAGNLFFTRGYQTNGASFYFTGNGLSSGGWGTIANVQDVWCFGFGAVASGFTAPTLWIVGWVNKGGAGYKFGVWKSRDLGASDWTWYGDFLAGTADVPTAIIGDMNDSTKCFVGYGGVSTIYGTGLN